MALTTLQHRQFYLQDLTAHLDRLNSKIFLKHVLTNKVDAEFDKIIKSRSNSQSLIKLKLFLLIFCKKKRG